MEKGNRLFSLDGLRVLAIFGVVLYHGMELFLNKTFALGSVCVYTTFVLSGFLFGYYSWDKYEDYKLKDSVEFTKKKILKFYPLHFVMFLIGMYYEFRWLELGEIISKYQLARVMTNVLLVQCYVPRSDFYFSFNGVSWFLAVLIPLYFLSPILSNKIFYFDKKRLVNVAIVLEMVFAIIVLVFCRYERYEWLFFNTPLLHVIEYMLGILAGRISWLLQNEKVDKADFYKHLFLLMILSGVVSLITNIISKCVFGLVGFLVVVLCGCIVWLVNGHGYVHDGISAFLGNRAFVFLAKFSFEVYMIHQIVDKFAVEKLHGNRVIDMLITMAVTLVLSYAWNWFLGIKKRVKQ